MLPYRSIHLSSDCDVTFKVVVHMLAVVLEIKKKNKNCTRWSTRCCLTGAHSVQPIAMKLSQVVGNVLAVLPVLPIIPILMKFCTLDLRNKRKVVVCMTIPLSHPYYLAYLVF